MGSNRTVTKIKHVVVLMSIAGVFTFGIKAYGKELSVTDFQFTGPLGSAGAQIEKIDTNHFRVTLGHAPNHTDWSNKLQFQIKHNAEGNTLRLDVVFNGGDAYIFNEYFHSWSHDARNWQPIHWQKQTKDSKQGDTLLFPRFTNDRVYVGHQVPMSYEDSLELIDKWKRSPYVKVHTIGRSLGRRIIYRLEITDPRSPHPESKRWAHYFANQHPGEHNAQWRMVGMINWLLSEEGRDCRRRSISHFVLMMSPDAPSQGWYRVNAQGVDMNRSYRAAGADWREQAHEAYVCQKDLEALMRSRAPITTVWSMHTWPGIVETICLPGPEMGTRIGAWTEFREILARNDGQGRFKPLAISKQTRIGDTTWTDGPHAQFGVSAFLCEGGGGLDTKDENLQSGITLMRSIAEYYQGTKRQ